MGKLFESAKFMNIKDLKDLASFLTQFTTQVANLFNGGLRFQDNMKCQIIEVNFPLAYTDVRVVHNLNSAISGVMDYSNLIGGTAFFSPTLPPTSKNWVFLQATVAGKRTIILFV